MQGAGTASSPLPGGPWEEEAGTKPSPPLAFRLHELASVRASDALASTPSHPNLERFGAYLGLLLGLGLSVRNGLKGWANIYLGNENYWDAILWRVIGPLLLLALLALPVWIWLRPVPGTYQSKPPSTSGVGPAGPGVSHVDVFPHAYRLVWLVLLVQNAIAQLITGPHSSWNETAFALYYVLLFLLSAVILHHFQFMKVFRNCSPT